MNPGTILCRLLQIAAILFAACGVGFNSYASEDILKIRDIAAGEKQFVLLQAWNSQDRERCASDKVFTSTTGEFRLGNLLADRKCNLEVAVFSEKHAVLLKTLDITGDKLGKIHYIGPLERAIRVPVTIWLARRDAEAIARDEMNNANLLFTRNNVGIQFDPHYEHVWDNQKALKAINAGIKQQSDGDKKVCTAAVNKLRNSDYYTRDTLNVYYVVQWFKGRNCAIHETPDREATRCKDFSKYPKTDGNITYIGTDATLSTLAHELGHAFGLRPGSCGGHADLGNYNIMFENRFAESSDRFTLGQVFRMNIHRDKWGGSMLLENKLRSGPERECPPLDENGGCPALGLDWDGNVLGGSRKKVNESEPAKALGALTAWLECVECESGELRAVTDYGDSIVPDLIATLRRGTSTTRNEPQRKELAARYADLEEQARTEPIKFKMISTRSQFIERYMQGYGNQYRIRAAQALGAIGGTQARQELEAALRDVRQKDIRPAIQRSLRDHK